MIKFVHHRLCLKERNEPDLFTHFAIMGPGPIGREDWLRDFFSSERHFKHQNNEFVFQPISVDEKANPKNLVLGWVARSIQRRERMPPNLGLKPHVHEGWQASLLILDPSHHDDGQKALLEEKQEVGTPLSIMRSLAKALNDFERFPYEAQVYNIVSVNSFYDFAAKNGDEITKLAFDTAVPNMFGSASDYEKDLKYLDKVNNVSRVKTQLESETKIEIHKSNIKEIVNYTEKGAGEIKAKAGNGKSYSSGEHAQVTELELDDHLDDQENFIISALKNLANEVSK